MSRRPSVTDGILMGRQGRGGCGGAMRSCKAECGRAQLGAALIRLTLQFKAIVGEWTAG